MEPIPPAILERLKTIKDRPKTPEEEHLELIEQAQQHPATLARLAAEAGRESGREDFLDLGGIQL